VYQQIFAGVSSDPIARTRIARAVRQLREAWRRNNCAVTAAQCAEPEGIDPAHGGLAYAVAGRPARIGRRRGRYANWRAGRGDAGRAALQWVSAYLAKHGVEGGAHGGGGAVRKRTRPDAGCCWRQNQ